MSIDFDIVICVGPNDSDVIANMIQYTKKNIIGYRKIFLICKDPGIKIDGTYTIDERIFPFSIQDINKFLNELDRSQWHLLDRTGWYLQQLLKLYAGNIIPDILEKYLVLDSDTFFLKPTTFIDSTGKGLFNFGDEYNVPYFGHMTRLHPSLYKFNNNSGICHHMMFFNNLINEMFRLVEDYHNNDLPFWRIFLDCIDKNDTSISLASEYEIYFTYIQIHHPDKYLIRKLNWLNSHAFYNYPDKDYISVHWYMRSNHCI